MKLIKVKKSGELDQVGRDHVTLMPTVPEDMWHANNLIRPGDILQAHALRRVVLQTDSGKSPSTRVHANLTIKVTSTFFDPPNASLQVSGTIAVATPVASMGQYHTLDLELNRQFTLWKAYGWDSVATDELNSALQDDSKNTALLAAVMDETHASVCLVSDHQTIVVKKIEGRITKKLSSSAPDSAGRNKFYNKIVNGLRDVGVFETDRVFLLCSPGYTAQNILQYIKAEAARTGNAALKIMQRNAVVAHVNSGNPYSLSEAIKTPAVSKLVSSAKFRDEGRLMDQLTEKLRSDIPEINARVSYGVQPVTFAVDEGAVGNGGTLLINNSLFRSDDPATRQRYVAIVDAVKEMGGDVRLLSSAHESGQRLANLGGIAAILTYAVHDGDVEDEDYAPVYEVDEDERDMIV